MDRDVDIAIIGAGLAGAATAYHLKRLGVSRVVVLEQEASPGEHSSGLNASMIREQDDDTDIRSLASEGAAAIRTGEFGVFRPTGSYLIGLGDDDVSQRVPPAAGCGRWCPGDGVADPAAIVRTFLQGQDVRYETKLLSWHANGAGVNLETNRGSLRARIMVNAAGPWAGSVGNIPVSPLNRHLFLTSPVPSVAPNWPFVWDVEHGLYFRPEGDSLLMCACDEQQRAPGDYRVDHDVEIHLARLLDEHQPSLRNVAIKARWTGQRTFAEDRKPVIGFDPRCNSLFHIAALGGHGVTCSFAVGRVAAEMITGASTEAAAPLDPARLLTGADCPA